MCITRLDVSLPDETLPADADALTRLLLDRYSCRAYQKKEVDRATINQMFAIAQLTPSWCNSQPWEAIVTRGAGTERFRDALFAAAKADIPESGGLPSPNPDLPFPTAYTGIYKERQREVGWRLYESVGIAFGDRIASAKQMLENFRLFGAPHIALITSDRNLGIYGAIDCGGYIANLMLAAQALGIGMIPQAALANYAPLVRQHFDIGDDRLLVLGCSFGHPDDAHPVNSFRSPRADPKTVVRWVEA